jgi:hypothetical protein
MNILTSLGLSTLFDLILSWLLGEVKDLWKDGTLREIAKNAIEWAEGALTDNDEKRDAAIDKIIEDAKEVGKDVAKDGALMLVELSVQRYLKN